MGNASSSASSVLCALVGRTLQGSDGALPRSPPVLFHALPGVCIDTSLQNKNPNVVPYAVRLHPGLPDWMLPGRRMFPTPCFYAAEVRDTINCLLVLHVSTIEDVSRACPAIQGAQFSPRVILF